MFDFVLILSILCLSVILITILNCFGKRITSLEKQVKVLEKNIISHKYYRETEVDGKISEIKEATLDNYASIKELEGKIIVNRITFENKMISNNQQDL